MATSAATRVSAHDRREQILDVAMLLFASQGFEGTTTREVAHKAGVNEAIIFRHFPTKEHLYWAIIERKCQNAGRTQMIEECIARGGSDLEIFSSIASRMLTRGVVDRNITRLLLFTALERHELSDKFFQNYVAHQYEALAEHISRRVGEGAFREINPTLAARGFLGMLIYHYLVQELFSGNKLSDFDPVETGRSLAELWLRGVVAESKPARANGIQKRRNGKHSVCVMERES